MKFEEAIVEYKKGKKIRLSNWATGIFISDMGKNDILIVDHTLLHSTDWEILEEPGKSLPEVFDAFKEGKKIRRKSWPDHSWINEYGIRNNCLKESLATDLLCTDWEIVNE